MRRVRWLILVLMVALAAWLGAAGPATAVKRPDIGNTKHNLSTSGPSAAARATGGLSPGDTTGSQICIFCHTPHGAENQPGAPLWNRQLSNASYTTYESKSMEAYLGQLAGGPMGLSKLCLSCHDGTLALGSVNVANGKTLLPTQKFPMTSERMPAGHGVDTGFTRNLGTDLSNDHPISFTYDSTLAGKDGELRSPPVASTVPPPPGGTAPVVVGTRVAGEPRPLLPLEDGKVQCTTCHDPHLREDDATQPPAKFLRLNRLQKKQPGGTFSETDDIFCIACHDKGGQLWALSAHANDQVAVQTFSTDPTKGNPNPSALREFPAGTQVWQAGCLSCHDTHTVKGARRLLREGTGNTDGTTSPSPLLPRSGGLPAIEETCYQCHSPSTESILNITDNALVPDIKSDFKSTYRMPITAKEQRTKDAIFPEPHNIGFGAGTGKDFVEDPALLVGANRHAECTDCHNPHRVIKNKKFNDSANAPVKETHGGTHTHADGVMHTNIASGVLKGTTGVEPNWPDAKFRTNATFTHDKAFKRGVGNGEAAGEGHVTREYQVCLKCHSSYAYSTSPPVLGWPDGGGTVSPRTGFDNYTDQAMEFQPPEKHRGAASQTDSGAFDGVRVRRGCTAPDNATACPTGCTCATMNTTTLNFTNNNHRSWHPVIGSTGRDLGARGIAVNSNPWRQPWAGFVGSQTMYCSDCHGSNTGAATVVPTGNNPWGPHGSSNRFILKGEWSTGTGANGDDGGYTTNALCFKCHNPANYANRSGGSGSSAFNGGGKGNLHAFHTDRLDRIRCNWCHIAVPHGWKNRSFLVNLNDVGPEVPGMTAGTEVSITSGTAYTNGPYYSNAKLKIRSFATPGNWQPSNCGSATGQGGTGQEWMKNVCESPP